MELRILGPLEVLDDDGLPVDVGGARPRTLLIDLALAHGQTVPADQLLEDVWSSESIPARNNLQVHVSRLRRALGEERITTRSGGYALELPADALDATRFDRLAAEGRAALDAGAPAEAAASLRSALALWRGSALVDFADDPFARPVITRLEESRFAAIEDRVEADLMLGRHSELIGELEALVQDHPLRERLWAQLMTALYRSGRQADALRAYQRARTELAEQLGIDPGPELRALEAAVLAQDPALVLPPSEAGGAGTDAGRAPRSNLPAATDALIGRAHDIDSAAALVREHRLVTVVGAGGVGKTRLALEVGHGLLPEFDDGVYLVDLAAVADASGVAGALGAALGVEAEFGAGASTDMRERLGEYLRGRATVLVLDNCEHVIAESARVVEHLVARCGDLRVLATSREPLMIGGEVLWPLSPLELDAAAELFGTRARAVVPGFDAGGENAATVRTICDHLDCLPLAIELAAARMRAFTPQDLLHRLDDRFRLLTGGARTAFPRQQTLRAVLDWSYDLLFDDERRVLERISVFAGTFTLAGAEQVCADDRIQVDDVAELLARLVDKSLVMSSNVAPASAVPFTGGGGIEFRLLKTLAQYANERLDASGDAGATRTRHARYMANIVDVSDAAHGVAWGDWFGVIGRMVGDVRLATEWALGIGDPDLACSLAGGLGWYWNMGGRIDDTWKWLTIALSFGEPTKPARRVRALAWAGAIGVTRDSEQALEYGAEGVRSARELGDDAAVAITTMLHGSTLSDFYHRADATTALFEESRAAFEAVGDYWSLAMSALLQGAILLVQGDFDGAIPAMRECADRFGELDNAWGRGVALRHLADVAMIRGHYDHARAAFRDAVAGLHSVGAVGASAGLTARLAHLSALEGHYDDADRLFDEALAAAERQRYVPTLALTYNLRGTALRRRGRLDDAEQCHRGALALYVERGAPAGLSLTLASLGYIAELRGDAERAAEHHRASLEAACEADDLRSQALALEGLAGVAALAGDDAAVGRLVGAATVLRERTGGRLVEAERDDVDRALARVVDRAAFDTAYLDGSSDPVAVIAAA